MVYVADREFKIEGVSQFNESACQEHGVGSTGNGDENGLPSDGFDGVSEDLCEISHVRVPLRSVWLVAG